MRKRELRGESEESEVVRLFIFSEMRLFVKSRVYCDTQSTDKLYSLLNKKMCIFYI